MRPNLHVVVESILTDIVETISTAPTYIRRERCTSLWNDIPNDTLWRSRGEKQTLYTQVRRDSLDFHNTPLEQRYNLSPNQVYIERAENDRDRWVAGKVFIPSKIPTPRLSGSVGGS